jgi:hypothetical protein
LHPLESAALSRRTPQPDIRAFGEISDPLGDIQGAGGLFDASKEQFDVSSLMRDKIC